MKFTGKSHTDDASGIFKSVTIEDSSEPLPYEPGVGLYRTIGTKTLRIECAEGLVLGIDDVEFVVIGEHRFRRQK